MMGSVCHAEDITIRFNGTTAKVTQQIKDSVNVTVDGARVNIESLYKDHKLTLFLTGKSDDGQLILKTVGKAKVKLGGLTLTSQEGAPLDLKNKKKVEIVAANGTKTRLPSLPATIQPTIRLPPSGQRTSCCFPARAHSTSSPQVMVVVVSKPRKISPSRSSLSK